MKTFVWDTSAILNIKEPNSVGYSPGHSLFSDLSDGIIPGPYRNIFPTIAWFEMSASVSRKHREDKRILREFYILNDHSEMYSIDHDFIKRSVDVVVMDGFSNLHGADLIFACITFLENGCLVTLDNHFKCVSHHIDVLDLTNSRNSPEYRNRFGV